jgi:hypothetical protein
MDEADRAQQEIEALERAVHPYKRVPELIANGFCHYCGAAVRDGLRWCSSECGWAWQHEEERRKINGKPAR